MGSNYTPTSVYLQKGVVALQQITDQNARLHPKQAKKFIQMAASRSQLMSRVLMHPMTKMREELSLIGFGERILRTRGELQSVPDGERYEPQFSDVKLDCREYTAVISLTEQMLEENIEGQSFKNTMVSMISPAAFRDLEMALVRGDTTSGDAFYAQKDGLLRMATSNVVDHAGAQVDEDTFHDLMGSLPERYREDPGQLTFVTSVKVTDRLRRIRAQRNSELGDRYLEKSVPLFAAGAPIIGVSSMPSNLGVNQNESAILLLNTKNVIMGINKNIQMRWVPEPLRRILTVMAILEVDWSYQEEEGCAKSVGITY